MRSGTNLRRVLLVLAAGLPLSAAAADDAKLKALEQRLIAVEDRLAASEATVAAQKEELSRAKLPQVGQGQSGLDKFLSTLQIGGAVTSSYAYNFNDPDNNQGGNSLYQFNTDHNSFSLDAIKLELGRPASEPGSAGFQIDLLWGENANILGASSPTPWVGAPYTPPPPTGATVPGTRFYNSNTNNSRGPGDANVFVQEAYVSYNMRGTTLQLGKWETLLGYEVIDSRLNPNITQGLLFTFGIPLYHTGFLASGNIAEGIVWAAGVTNGWNNVSDYGTDKGLTGRLGLVGSNYSLLANGFYGNEQVRLANDTGVVVGDNDDSRWVLDFVGTLNPMDKLALWANFDIGEEAFSADDAIPAPEDAKWYGLALGGKFSFTPATSVAVRGEYFIDKNGSRLSMFNGTPAATNGQNNEVDAYSATVTLAHKLTDNLLGRVEYRFDHLDPDGPVDGGGILVHDNGNDNDQSVGIVEVSYSFD